MGVSAVSGERRRLRHPYLVVAGATWVLMNLANASATYYFYRAFARKGMLSAAWGSVCTHVLLPFEVSPGLGVASWALSNLMIALLFVGLIKWQRHDFSLIGGWAPAALYATLFAFLSPGDAVLVAINTGLGAAARTYASYRPLMIVFYVLLAQWSQTCLRPQSQSREAAIRSAYDFDYGCWESR